VLDYLKGMAALISVVAGLIYYSFKQGKKNAKNEIEQRDQEASLENIKNIAKEKRAIDALSNSDLDSTYDKLLSKKTRNNNK
jgi:hypothetical protein